MLKLQNLKKLNKIAKHTFKDLQIITIFLQLFFTNIFKFGL